MSQSQSPSPTSRKNSDSSSPEFEFQFNPSLPSPTSLHSADQLFFRGLLLPLHLLPSNSSENPDPIPNLSSEIISSETEPSEPSPSPSILSAGITASKRWRHVFMKTDKKPPDEDKTKKSKDSHKSKEKDKKKEIRKSSGGGSGSVNSAELNINLWPFSRSRSAGNNSGRTKSGVTNRKVSSAPCSRSNSAGESKSRRTFPNSPARISGGVHLGRTSPVWHLSRTTSGRSAEKGKKAVKSTGASTAGKVRVLNLSVPMCIGYRNHLSCRSDEASVVGGDGDGDGDGGSRNIVGSNGGNLFGLRNLFTKKVY